MEVKPYMDKLLIRPAPLEENFFGLIIPDTFKRGVVVAAGDGKPGAPMMIKENQTVFYQQDDALPCTLEGEQLMILEDRKVWLFVV